MVLISCVVEKFENCHYDKTHVVEDRGCFRDDADFCVDAAEAKEGVEEGTAHWCWVADVSCDGVGEGEIDFVGT